MKSISHQFATGFALLGATAILAIGAMTTNQAIAAATPAAASTPDSSTVQTVATHAAEQPLLYGR